MKNIEKDVKQIAFCGLYCSACTKYLKEKCPGCVANEKASWCKIRSCCMEKQIKSCADCEEYSDPMDCKFFNNFFSRLFGFFFGTDRKANIDLIKEMGYDKVAEIMTERQIMCLKKKNRSN